MLKKIIITTALLCTQPVWGTQAATEISNEYITKVTVHLDGLEAQSLKIEQAEEAADQARSTVRSATRDVESVEKDLEDANDNLSAYPRRIKRDGDSITDKRSESDSIFRNTFPEFNTPEEAIRSVNRQRNRLQEEKNVLEGRLQRKINEFNSAFSRARSEEQTSRRNLNNHRSELSRLESRISTARQEFQQARQAFQRAKDAKEDPQLPNKIRRAEETVEEIRQVITDRGADCENRRRDNRGLCNRYRDAKRKVRNLKAIAAPGSLQPYRQRRNQAETNLENLRQRKRQLATNTDRLEDNLRRAVSRIADLEEELRIVTNPIRGSIADVDGRLNRLSSKIALAQRLQALESDIGSLQRRIARNEEKLAALPALIEKLQDDAAVVRQTLENAMEASADLNEELAREQNVLTDQKNEINALRAAMNDSLSSVVELAPNVDVVPNLDTEIMTSTDWSVLTTDLDNEWNRATCRAETLEIVEEGDSEVITSANLKVVNLVNPTSGFNEPVVVMTVDSAREDLVNYNSVTVRVSRSKTYNFDLIYSKSTKNKLFFMADLNDREGLIKIILERSRMEVMLTNLTTEASTEITFSLRGSTKALNSRSSRDNSLRNACGGINISEI